LLFASLLLFETLFVSAQLNNSNSTYSNVIDMDINGNGKFEQDDLSLMNEGYKINLVDGKTMLYIVDTLPSNGRLKCSESCLEIPYYTDNIVEMYLLREYIALTLGGNISDSNVSDNYSSSSIFSFFLLLFSQSPKVSGYQAQDGYTPQASGDPTYNAAKDKLDELKDKAKNLLTTPENKKYSPVDDSLAQDFVNKLADSIRKNLPSEGYSSMNDAQKKAFKQKVKEDVAKAYGFSSTADAIGAALNPFNRERQKLALNLKKIQDNVDFDTFTTKNDVDLMSAITTIADYESKNPKDVSVAKPQSLPPATTGPYGTNTPPSKGVIPVSGK